MRGLLIDVDGVLHVGDVPIPGAVETLAEVRARGVPFRLLTNTTRRPRRALGAGLREIGFDVDDDEIMTAVGATVDYVRRRFPGQPVHLLANPDIAEDFDGVPLATGAGAGVVVVGDAGEGFTFAAMNAAFRALMDGAALVAMHRSPWWETAEGQTIDMGAFVKGLEYSSAKRAVMVGKPSVPFFRAGFRALGLPPQQVAMVGDTIRQDVLPAMRLGATGVLVRTGMFREGDLDVGAPDVVLESIAGLIPSLDTIVD